MVGQIDRFGLTSGLLLVDEPELHLNAELLRSWVGFLRDSIVAGQIWLATHSLDVVETSKVENTFVLERNSTNRLDDQAASLSSRALLDALSRSVGSPAFSVSRFVFIYVEGEESLLERERFARILGTGEHVRYIESGNSASVQRQVETLRTIERETNQPIRLGGIVDRDFRDQAATLPYTQAGLHVLGVHEVENFYLYPDSLRELIRLLGGDVHKADEYNLEESDKRAGIWIAEATRTSRNFRNYAAPASGFNEFAIEQDWLKIAPDMVAFAEKLAKQHGSIDTSEEEKLRTYAAAKANTYSRVRVEGVWKRCEGKEVFRGVVGRLGITEIAAEKAIARIWKEQPNLMPQELRDARVYVSSK